ncbi:MAG: hypothetical protein KGL19_13890 [Bacteroidota bacterium]|nr:hypothetical protein [Bacteroidota bacterium]
MKQLPLFPHSWRRIGYILLPVFLAIGIAYLFFDYKFPFLQYHKSQNFNFIFSENNFTDELASLGTIIGLLLIGFSKEKTEDEMIQFIRLESLHWAVYANYLVMALCIIFVYGGAFFYVMIWNMFTILIIFIVRFKYLMHQYNKSNQ